MRMRTMGIGCAGAVGLLACALTADAAQDARHGALVNHQETLTRRMNAPGAPASLFGPCGAPGSGPCTVANGTPGCVNQECCELVCAIDPYCCEVEWDSICADETSQFAEICGGCTHLSNDHCSDAYFLGVPSSSIWFTDESSVDDAPACGTAITAPGVWFVVAGTGTTMTATTCGDFFEYDTKVTVFCGDCAMLRCIDGNDDDCPDGASGLLSTVTWCSQAGAEYLILVHGFAEDFGGFELSVFDDGVPCAADVECLPTAPTGACCFFDGSCEALTMEACHVADGAFQGEGVPCFSEIDAEFVSTPHRAIPDEDAIGATDTLVVSGVGSVLDVNVDLAIDHTSVGDLCAILTGPDGTSVTLLQRMGFDGPCDATGCCGCGGSKLDIVLDDEAMELVEDQCVDGLAGSYVPDGLLSAFDGLSGDGPWTLRVSDSAEHDTGTLVQWSLHFEGGDPVPTCEPQFVELPLDIKPGSCPNSWNPSSRGVLPVAVLGAGDLDVMLIDLASVRIARADGIGGMTGPNIGPPGPSPGFGDVSSPFMDEPCDCDFGDFDGWTDLILKFDTSTTVETLELGDLPGGSTVELCVTGSFMDGTPFVARDCVRLVPPSSSPIRLDAGAAAAHPVAPLARTPTGK